MRKSKLERRFLYLYVVLMIFLVACSNEFEEHYNPSRQIDENIIQLLSKDAQLSEFVTIIDKLGLRKTLGEAAIYTCLAPTNEHVDAFLKEKGYSKIDDVPVSQLRQYVNYHFINGMYYKYDIEKSYKDASKGANNGLNPTKSTFYKTRSENSFPGKYIKIFNSYFFTKQADDFRTIYGSTSDGFSMETAKISDSKYDIDASNGVNTLVINKGGIPLPYLKLPVWSKQGSLRYFFSAPNNSFKMGVTSESIVKAMDIYPTVIDCVD